jgi:hypothetical protein
MRQHALLAVTVTCWLAAVPVVAQEESHEHHHAEAEVLGRVNFPVTCKPELQPAFDRAVALLHSFGYELARQAFADVAAQDPACGMARWGVAMTYYHPIWAPPTPAELTAGRTAAEEAARVGAKSEREQGFIAAIGAFYKDSDKLDHRTRALAYKAGMEKVTAAFPDDDEAALFYALSLLGTAPPTDTTYANQKKAAEIANRLLPKYPDHPGILHYIIHSFDYPELASLALPAARAYSKVAPSSPHALHMPSHIFTRLGLWQESIASNLASAAAAKAQMARNHPGATSFDDLHALDYLEYAYLQLGDDRKAREVLDEVAKASRFDEANFAAGYSLVAVPARYALERRDWRAAAALAPPAAELPWERFSYSRGITSLTNVIGAARLGELDRARKGLADLEALHAALVKEPPAGPYDWAGNVEAMRLAAGGWVAFAEGRKEDAVKLLTAAADKEDAVGKHPVTPGAVLPAREQLGDLLLELGKPREALAAYEASLANAPKRFNGLAGAARAAELAGEPARARGFYQELLALCGPACERPEAGRAKAVVSGR